MVIKVSFARTGRSVAIREFIKENTADGKTCTGPMVVNAFPDQSHTRRAGRQQIYRDLNNQVHNGFLSATLVDGLLHYAVIREPVPRLSVEERDKRRAAAQKRAQKKRAERRRAAREPSPRLVLPTVPIPAQAPSGGHVETVEEFRARCPSGYEVLPKKWPEILHYGRMADRLGAKG